MNHALMEKIAQAVLYEGYILYPYRPCVKSQCRWTFGGLFPQRYSETHKTGDAWFLLTECIVRANESTLLEAQARFLHLTDRKVARLIQPVLQWQAHADPVVKMIDSLSVDGKKYQRWQEAVEREIDVKPVSFGQLLAKPLLQDFAFPANIASEYIHDAQGATPGMLVREQQAIAGSIEISAEKVGVGVFRISVRISNRTDFASSGDTPSGLASRDDALLRALVSTHVALGVVGGEFVSMIDPPGDVKEAVAACRNAGVWPVLVGDAGATDAMLASPIILYDYPQIAPESPGDLFDGCEIDEILTLRVMTLTAEEKRDASAIDARAGEMLKRTETLAREQLMNLHGAMRNVNPFPAADVLPVWDTSSDRPKLPSVRRGGVDLYPGDRVRLRPRGGADAFDLVLDGKTATIAVIEQDFEDRIHLAVTIDEDPGADFGVAGKPGHRFFFRPEEVEPLG